MLLGKCMIRPFFGEFVVYHNFVALLLYCLELALVILELYFYQFYDLFLAQLLGFEVIVESFIFKENSLIVTT